MSVGDKFTTDRAWRTYTRAPDWKPHRPPSAGQQGHKNNTDRLSAVPKVERA